MSLPTLFISHGSPMLAVEPRRTGAMLTALGQALPTPRAILVISAHWMTRVPTVSTAAQPETIHDFGGFPRVLYTLQYPAPGAPALAESIANRLTRAGIATTTDSQWGLDHGAWVPLRYLYPDATIPVLQLSLPAGWSPAQNLAYGRALRGLGEEGVLVIGSGSLTHNIRDFMMGRKDTEGRGAAFCNWFNAQLDAGDLPALLDYRRQAPYAEWAHPTDEHLLPFYVALGAADEGAPHHGLAGDTWEGSMITNAFLFGEAPAGLPS